MKIAITVAFLFFVGRTDVGEARRWACLYQRFYDVWFQLQSQLFLEAELSSTFLASLSVFLASLSVFDSVLRPGEEWRPLPLKIPSAPVSRMSGSGVGPNEREWPADATQKSPNQLAALIASACGWLCLSAILLGREPRKTNKAVRMTSIIAITAHAK